MARAIAALIRVLAFAHPVVRLRHSCRRHNLAPRLYPVLGGLNSRHRSGPPAVAVGIVELRIRRL